MPTYFAPYLWKMPHMLSSEQDTVNEAPQTKSKDQTKKRKSTLRDVRHGISFRLGFFKIILIVCSHVSIFLPGILSECFSIVF